MWDCRLCFVLVMFGSRFAMCTAQGISLALLLSSFRSVSIRNVEYMSTQDLLLSLDSASPRFFRSCVHTRVTMPEAATSYEEQTSMKAIV